jgi:hypothetical protein
MDTRLDKTILDKKLKGAWYTSGSAHYIAGINSDEMLFMRLTFFPDETFDLYFMKRLIFVDWDTSLYFQHYKDGKVIAGGDVENVYWEFIEQLFIKVENTFKQTLDYDWWETVNRMKEIYEEF